MAAPGGDDLWTPSHPRDHPALRGSL